MAKGLIVKIKLNIEAPVKKVWEALISPELIKQYLFGTKVVSDWKVGSSIKYKGEWQGKSYEDKGTILKLVPEKIFQSTYWSSMGGLEDKPENYATVTYELKAKGKATELTLTQDNNPSEESREHSEKNWQMVLDTMKKLLEKSGKLGLF